MNNPSILGGKSLLIILAVLGIFSLFDILLYFLFIAVLVYYVYRLEKRIANLEAGVPSEGTSTPQS